MELSLARRVLLVGLAAACVGLVPVVHDDLGAHTVILPLVLSGVVVCELAAFGLLLSQFLARGSAALLGLASTFLLAGLIDVAHALVLPGALGDAAVVAAGSPADAWLWAIGHAGLALGIAGALWGGPREARRALAAPAAPRVRYAIMATLAVATTAAGFTWAVVRLGSQLPDVADGGALLGWAAYTGAVLVAMDAAVMIVVIRRGRRSMLEQRLLVVVACGLAGTVLTVAAAQRYSVGWYASLALELVGSAVALITLLGEVGRLGAAGVPDRRAGARDPLTGLHTRPATLVTAEHLHRSRADGAPLALAVIDVDGLAAIGQTHGPLAADAVLLAVAQCLREHLREVDVLGRSGEEGFLVVLPETDAEGVTLAVDRAVAAIRRQPVGTWARDVRTTASGGIAMVGEGDHAVAEALAAADLALSRAKAHGRDQVVSPTRGLVVPLRRAGAGPPPG